MLRSSRCDSSTNCSRMERRVRERQRRRSFGGHASSSRRLREVPHSATCPIRNSKRRPDVLLHMPKLPDIHAISFTGAAIRLLDPRNSTVRLLTPVASWTKVLTCFYRIIPLSIVGATKFYDTLTNFLGLIGYWASAFAAVILVEHFVIRKGRFEAYDLRYWNSPRKLPTGLAALGACGLACGVVVPSMDQVWFVGPIARHTGDIGFELAFVATALLYSPLRYLELRFRKLV